MQQLDVGKVTVGEGRAPSFHAGLHCGGCRADLELVRKGSRFAFEPPKLWRIWSHLTSWKRCGGG